MGPGAASGVAPRFPGDRFDLRRARTGQARTRHAGTLNRAGPGPDRPGLPRSIRSFRPPPEEGQGVTAVVTPLRA